MPGTVQFSFHTMRLQKMGRSIIDMIEIIRSLSVIASECVVLASLSEAIPLGNPAEAVRTRRDCFVGNAYPAAPSSQ